MPIGSKQTLKFKGSAVHGGGSCQVSLTTDNPATKNSKWIVIHSIVGGCPARGASGNGADTYDYTIPQGVSPGTYTLAWTWFNKIANREMYMNCANVKITSSTSKRDIYTNGTEDHNLPELTERATTNFPAMFVANIPTIECETVDNVNVLFPDPGASVESAAADPQASSNKPVAPTGPKCGSAVAAAAAAPTGATGSGGSALVSPPAVSAAAGGASAPSGAASPASSAALPESKTTSMAAAPSAAPLFSVPVSAPAPVPTAPSVTPPIYSNSSSSTNSTSNSAAPASSKFGTCTQPGQSICSPDGTQIGECTMGNTVTWIPVAAGTKCVGGYMVNGKRSVRFAGEYVGRVLG